MSLTERPMSSYCASIDGLRAIAVLSVVLFHADFGFKGGYVGVDIFFIISGYLITGLILKDLEKNEFKLADFWERRVRRIFPALAAVVITCIAVAAFTFLPLDLLKFGQSVFAQAVLSSNFYFCISSGYFDQAAELKPLLHTWSLAVEEQFYILFPLLLIALNRLSRKAIPLWISVAAIGSFSLSVFASYHYPIENFYLLPTRAWELLIGSLIAAAPKRQQTPTALSEILSGVGAIAILWSICFYNRETRFPGVAATLPCIGTGLIIWCNGTSQTVTCIGRVLALRPLVFVGLISYSLYLWHWPLLVFAKYGRLDPLSIHERIGVVLASLALAVLSWKFIETPFRKKVILGTRSQIFTISCITTCLFLIVGLAAYKLQGLPTRFAPSALNYTYEAAGDRQTVTKISHMNGLKEALAGEFLRIGSVETPASPRILLWGDSHAVAIVPIVDTLCKEFGHPASAAVYAGTPPLVGYQNPGKISLKDSIAYNNAVIQFIRNNQIKDVILAAEWKGYINISGPETVRAGLIASIKALRESGSRIWILREVPLPRTAVPLALDVAVMRGNNPTEIGIPLFEYQSDFRAQDTIFKGLPEEFTTVTLLDPSNFFVTSRDLCRVELNGKPLYCDESHLSSTGAHLLRPLFEPIFRDARAQGRNQ